MDAHHRGRTALRYRFAHIGQARAHVHATDGRFLLFYRDRTLRLLPYAPISLELVFDQAEQPRLLHGWVLNSVEGEGTWLELVDARPLHDVSVTSLGRRWRRLGCDLLVQARWGAEAQMARLLDLSLGGARLSSLGQMPEGRRLELDLFTGDVAAPLCAAYVAWSDAHELGVQFDRLDVTAREAVARAVRTVEQAWSTAWDAVHAEGCCSGGRVDDPEPPRLRPPARGTG